MTAAARKAEADLFGAIAAADPAVVRRVKALAVACANERRHREEWWPRRVDRQQMTKAAAEAGILQMLQAQRHFEAVAAYLAGRERLVERTAQLIAAPAPVDRLHRDGANTILRWLEAELGLVADPAGEAGDG